MVGHTNTLGLIKRRPTVSEAQVYQGYLELVLDIPYLNILLHTQ